MSYPPVRLPVTRVLLIAVTCAVAGCLSVPSMAPEDCERSEYRVEAQLPPDGSLDPEMLTVCRGQFVTLSLASDRGGVLHVHGYDSWLPAQEVKAGDTVLLEFEAGASGQFPIEFHAEADPQGRSVGVLTVLEPYGLRCQATDALD